MIALGVRWGIAKPELRHLFSAETILKLLLQFLIACTKISSALKFKKFCKFESDYSFNGASERIWVLMQMGKLNDLETNFVPHDK